MNLLSQLKRLHGWRELFAGLQPSLAGTAMSQGVYFFLYSTLRQQAVHRRQAGLALGVPRVQDISVFESLLVAALAGAGNVLVNNPIWLVATRMQVRLHSHGSALQCDTSHCIVNPNGRIVKFLPC